MDTIPFHWDTPDALQCLRMACLCPDECHESWLCSKIFSLHTCWQPVPQRIISANVDHGTAAGINALRRLKIKRCGELASRLSSLLTFAYVYVVVRAIHPGRPAPPGAIVDVVPCLDVVIFGTSRHGMGNTDICRGACLSR